MFLYFIRQPEELVSWETFDSAVVVALSEEQAKTIHPDGKKERIPRDDLHSSVWPNDPNLVTAECIGTASEKYTEPMVIIASFNAG